MSCAPGGYDTSIMRPSLPGASARSIANRSFTSAASAETAASIRSAAREAQQHTGSFFMVFLSGSSSGHAIAASPCHPTVPSAWRAGSGSCLCAAEPFVEPDAAEARVAQRHERALLDPAAVVAGLGVTYDLPRVADRLQIAGDECIERGAFRPSDLDDAPAWRRERHLGGDGRHVVRRDRLEQAGRQPDGAALRTRLGDAAEEFHELGGADDGVEEAGGLD